jgi:hypothetical protein
MLKVKRRDKMRANWWSSVEKAGNWLRPNDSVSKSQPAINNDSGPQSKQGGPRPDAGHTRRVG